jgi:hypothetical protein
LAPCVHLHNTRGERIFSGAAQTVISNADAQSNEVAMPHAVSQRGSTNSCPYNLTPQEIRNTVWSLAVQRIRNEPLLQSIAAAAIPKMSFFRPVEIASTAWAFSKLSVLDVQLMASISEAALTILDQFQP